MTDATPSGEAAPPAGDARAGRVSTSRTTAAGWASTGPGCD